jgi:glycerophosphoryl diester phosphodiesterase
VLAIGRAIVNRPFETLSFLTFAIGSALLVSGLINTIINLIGTTTFASLLFHSYRQFGNPEQDKITRLWHLTSDRSDAQIRITKFRIAAAAIACILLAALIGWWSARDMRLDNNVEIIAHRGASAFAPENTLASVRAAIDQDTDWVEIDVQETADGEVVVFHDSDFMKLAGLNRKIWEVDSDELAEIDVGSRFGDEFKAERVPTLSQVLEMCKGRAGVNIELKYYGHDQQLEQRVIDVVESHEMSDQVIYMSLKNEAVKKMKSLRPDCEAGLLLSVSVGNRGTLEADFLAVNAGFASRSMVRKTHQQGKKVFVWTVNDPVTMATMIGRGVDGLITDKPSLARKIIRERARLNAAERLMLEFTELFGITPEIGEQ